MKKTISSICCATEYALLLTICELKDMVTMLEEADDTVLFTTVQKFRGADQMTITNMEMV